ncbi:helix-turn-helix transcriptional regulator [Lysinibacillus xylanilyticus]|uniref:helix-turn-helix transcriptional regulator n=1 Tax=Lysinibacillus xylanilyticus TaxID=582475 RepID=UPI00083C995A|nr:hypothetical protein [Lysinibacillus xylanilyticus]
MLKGQKEMNKEQIEQALKDYRWMLSTLEIHRDAVTKMGDNGIKSATAQYGEEAGMPKGQGSNSDPVFNDVIRREIYSTRIILDYKRKVKEIQNRMKYITKPRDIEILHWMLEGKSFAWIGNHMKLSERHIRRIKDSIVDQMLEIMDSTCNKVS